MPLCVTHANGSSIEIKTQGPVNIIFHCSKSMLGKLIKFLGILSKELETEKLCQCAPGPTVKFHKTKNIGNNSYLLASNDDA